MIVPMKKIYIIVQKKNVVYSMEELGRLGIVHVEHQQDLDSEHVNRIRQDVDFIDKVISILRTYEEKGTIRSEETLKDWRNKAQEIYSLNDTLSRLNEEILKIKADIEYWQNWGNFNPSNISVLSDKGIYIYLCEVPVSYIDTLKKIGYVEQVSISSGIGRCLVVSREKQEQLPHAKIISLPACSLQEMEGNLHAIEQEKSTIVAKIKEGIKYLSAFRKIQTDLIDNLRFEEVIAGLREDSAFSILKGYCPEDRINSLQTTAKHHRWGLVVKDPSDEDRVPTLLRNPKWVELIKPVFQMIDVLPGYREKDISLVFLLFFSLFFGMLIGDAGYGVIFFIATFIAHKKLKESIAMREVFPLMYVLSSTAIVWGILSGTFFGQAWLPAGVKPVVPQLRDNNNVQMLCFLIGTIHLSIAHIWRAVLKAPSFAFLSEIGWLSILWGMFFLARMLVLGIPFPWFGIGFVVVGSVLVIFFSRPNKNLLKAIGPGLGEFFLNIISTFTDIVSYIRLFAVGLASVAVADAFNDMAGAMGFHSILSSFCSALILIAGHTFNIILGSMAILVHGLRLNVLEFSGHLNLEWTGFKYNPFCRKSSLSRETDSQST